MPAHLWLPPTGHGPGIVVLQEIFGVSDYIRRRAAQLAEQGYVVVAPEIFWRLGVTSAVEGEDALQQGMGLVQRLDWQAAVTDAAATVEWLRDRDEVTAGVGAVGFCFGGGLGFNVAAHLESDGSAPIDALVSYYGSALPGLHDLMTVTAPSLHHFGLADSFIDTETVRRIEASVTEQPAHRLRDLCRRRPRVRQRRHAVARPGVLGPRMGDDDRVPPRAPAGLLTSSDVWSGRVETAPERST